MAAEAPKLARDNTMQATAKEGIKFLEKEDPALAEECKSVTKEANTNGAGDASAAENGETKLVRDNTMVTTAQEGKEYLEKQGGVNAEAKTRSQEAELNKSLEEKKENGEEEKVATKRTAEQDKEVDDAKKQKTEGESTEEKQDKEEKAGDAEQKEE